MNIYLITSSSYNLINQEISKIVPESSNVIKYDLRKDSLSDAINEANYFYFDSSKKYIIIKSDDLFKASKKEDNLEIDNKTDISILEKYLNSPCDNSVLIFVSMSGVDKRKKIYKQISKVGKVVDIPELNKKDMVYKCIELLKKDGYSIDYETANVIVETSYVNYDILLNEIEKINILLKKGLIVKKDLKGVISESLNGNIYNYINSIINRDLKGAFESEKDFNQLKIDPIVVLITLAKEFQTMYLIKTHNNINDIQGLLHKEQWQIETNIKNASNYTVNELKNIIIKLCDYDVKLKKGEINKDFILSMIALDFC